MLESLFAGSLWLVWFALTVLSFVAMWKVFEKAGVPGWMALIPVLNLYQLLIMSGKPVWWLILYFIPVVNFITMIIVSMALAKKFGQSDLFGLGMAFFPFIFFFVLGFGPAQYKA